ncbi:MAG: hypothetical protein KGI88_08225 [Betaproteobacteria bacterium]|nr:hypothetical protein [Betaproteobacteria bacterium]
MKNNIDFIYEYSDLNLFQTRVEVLKGTYKGLIVEFGSSYLVCSPDSNNFTFNWTVYKKPENSIIYANDSFLKFLSELLIAVIDDRNKDPLRQEKLDEAASGCGKQGSSIKIDSLFYKDKVVCNATKNKQISSGVQLL